jgi:hypothetical protein
MHTHLNSAWDNWTLTDKILVAVANDGVVRKPRKGVLIMKALSLAIVVALGCSVTLGADTVAELTRLRHELLVKQQATAVAIAESAQKEYDNGKVELEELLQTYKDIVDVRLQLASSPSMRIYALDEYVKSLSAIEAKIADAERPVYDGPVRNLVSAISIR